MGACECVIVSAQLVLDYRYHLIIDHTVAFTSRNDAINETQISSCGAES
jgi:hypothetical protein